MKQDGSFHITIGLQATITETVPIPGSYSEGFNRSTHNCYFSLELPKIPNVMTTFRMREMEYIEARTI